MVYNNRSAFFLFLLFGLSPTSASHAENNMVWVTPGQSVDVYWELNLSGEIFVVADAEGQPACLNYWWITWPFGRVVKLGRHCGRATFELPGIGSLAIGGKLRAGGADTKTRLRGTADETVASKFIDINF